MNKALGIGLVVLMFLILIAGPVTFTVLYAKGSKKK